MIKILTIGIVALVILLVGATVVLAQDGTPGFGGTMQGRMIRTSATTPVQQDGSTATPTPGNPAGTGPYGMMNPDTLNAMRDAMQSGDWQHMHDVMGQYVPEQMQGMHDAMGQAMQSGDPQQMYDTCQNYFNGQNPGGTDGSTVPTGMMGGGTGSTTGDSGYMMGGRRI